MTQALDPIWEDLYKQGGHANRYPWDIVVSFVFRNAPRDRPRDQVRILEVGSGTGSNLLFAAREGFTVTGVEGSASAVEYAQKRFKQEDLKGDLRVGDFTRLPFADGSFDLVFDRASLTCVGSEHLRQAVAEIRRVLVPGGRFLFNPYADSHSSYRSGRQRADGLTEAISAGTVVDVGPLHFVSRREIDDLFASSWRLESVQRLEITDMLHAGGDIHAEWRVIAIRK